MKKRVEIVALSAVSLVLIGCGGGDPSSLPTTPSASQMAKITKENSNKITYSTINAVGLSDEDFDLDSQNEYDGRNLRVIATNLVRNFRYKKENCSGGGYIEGNFDSDTKGTIKAYNCYKDGLYLNGTVTQDKNDNYRYLSFQDFTTKKGDKSIHVKSGSIKVYYSKSYYESSKSKIEVNKLYADFKFGSKEIGYLNFNEIATRRYLNFNEIAIRKSAKINGYIKTPCSGGYVKIETKPEIKYDKNNDNDKNVTGKIDISSNNKTIHIDFKGDNVDVDRREVGGDIDRMTIDEFSQKVRNSCSAKLN